MNPNWHKPISEQVFTVEKNATLIGFSMGAVLAYLIAKNSPCKKVIFASLSPLHTFDFKEDLDLLSTYMSRKRALPIAEDWHNIKISLKTLRTPFVRLLGEYEKGMGTADILVPKGKHFVGRAYREEIVKLV